MPDFLRCWLICTDDFCMLGYGTTRSQAVDDFLGRYTDNTFDEFAAGYLSLRINRVPEHDPGFDTPRLEYSALATIRRGYSVHCEGGCGNESLVASLDQWPDIEDTLYQGYYVLGRVLCHDCALSHMTPYTEVDSGFAIRLMEGFEPCLVTH